MNIVPPYDFWCKKSGLSLKIIIEKIVEAIAAIVISIRMFLLLQGLEIIKRKKAENNSKLAQAIIESCVIG